MYNIEDDSQFEEVHMGMMKIMDSLFRQRINLYEIMDVREVTDEPVLDILYMTSGLTSVNKDAYPPWSSSCTIGTITLLGI